MDAHSQKNKRKRNKVPIGGNQRLVAARAPLVLTTPELRKWFSKTTPPARK
jgi:hypothetical protein